MAEERDKFEGWAILEVMGHRRMGGFVREETLAGAGVLRIDIPSDEQTVTQFYPPSSLYCLTPTTEATARAVANWNKPTPVHTYELLPAPSLRASDAPLDVEITDDEQALIDEDQLF